MQSGRPSVWQSQWEEKILWCARLWRNVNDVSCKVILKSRVLNQHSFRKHRKETYAHLASVLSLQEYKQFRDDTNLYILEPNMFCGTLNYQIFLRVQQGHFQIRPNYWTVDLNEAIFWKCNHGSLLVALVI